MTQVELVDEPGHHILLANTHLYYRSSVHFFQAIACSKYLDRLKNTLLENKEAKKVSILFAGDFNTESASHLFKYLTSQNIPSDELSQGLFSLNVF